MMAKLGPYWGQIPRCLDANRSQLSFTLEAKKATKTLQYVLELGLKTAW